VISDRSNTRRGPPPPTFHTTTPRPVGTIGDCFNTAPLESFWGSMQIELLDRRKWMTYVQLSIAMAGYIVATTPADRAVLSTTTRPNAFEALASSNSKARTRNSVDHEAGTRSGGPAKRGPLTLFTTAMSVQGAGTAPQPNQIAPGRWE